MSTPPSPNLDPRRLPRHLAIIMDGNGRWAQLRGLGRVEGHKRGKESVRAVVESCRRIGIQYLSLYAFSTENWNRPKREVDALMALLRRYLRTELKKMMENDIRLLAAGDLGRLPAVLQEELAAKIEATKNNRAMTVILCVSYGGREEIARAARLLAQDAKDGKIDPAEIDENMFASRLCTPGVPDPDLLIRTSGEMRISNFYLWQLAYSEIYVTNTLWPDFRENELFEALADYQRRERRFGGVEAVAPEALHATR